MTDFATADAFYVFTVGVDLAKEKKEGLSILLLRLEPPHQRLLLGGALGRVRRQLEVKTRRETDVERQRMSSTLHALVSELRKPSVSRRTTI